MEAAEDEYSFSLRALLQILWRRLWVILLVTIVLGGGALAFSLTQTPMYESSIRILVSQEQGSNSSGSLGSDVQGLQQLTETMSEGIASRPIAEAAIQQLDLQMSPEDFLENHLNVQQVKDTQFIQVDYMDTSPERASKVANVVGDVFSEQVSEVSPGANAVTATTWARAEVPDEPVSPNPARNALLGMVLGLLFGIGLAFLLDYLDDSWHSPEEAEQISGVPTFGVVPEFKSITTKKGTY